ncbi:MAG: hypothetical protein LBV41_10785 [Cytophagaceae bacterium]|jgi:hypothetical protein|nr:hypothetical protein [Cytophagaceae bacterium]
MNTEFEYYLIDSDNNPNYPTLDYKDVNEGDIFFKKCPLSEIKKLEMCLWKPAPKKPEMVDFHSVTSVLAFADSLYAILEPLKLHNVQFIPASVEVKKGTAVDGYWLMHNYNRVECMDLEKSDCDISEIDGEVSWIRKIVLSPEKLSKVPLEQRLFFRMKEDYPTHLVHKSIVDKITTINPKGIKFTPVEAWKQGMQFDE